jgi:hypothetical protein
VTVQGEVTGHDARRLRSTRRIALVGLLLGVLGAGGVGLIGASGRAGLAVLFAVTAAGCVAAALSTAVLAIVDEYRREPVGRRRIATALALFLGGAVLLLLSAAVVAGA